MAPSVREGVKQVFGQSADVDEDILEYIISVLEDDGFECGKEGEGIFDSVGMMLVRCTLLSKLLGPSPDLHTLSHASFETTLSVANNHKTPWHACSALQVSGGFCDDDDEAEKLCRDLATKLQGLNPALSFSAC